MSFQKQHIAPEELEVIGKLTSEDLLAIRQGCVEDDGATIFIQAEHVYAFHVMDNASFFGHDRIIPSAGATTYQEADYPLANHWYSCIYRAAP